MRNKSKIDVNSIDVHSMTADILSRRFVKDCCSNCRWSEYNLEVNRKIYCYYKRMHVIPDYHCGYYK